MDERERYEEYLQDELDEQFSIYSVSHLLSKLSDYSRIISKNEIPGTSIRNFKFLGFALGRNGKGIYVRVHPKSWKKFKNTLRELSSRRRCQSIRPSLEKIKVYVSTNKRKTDKQRLL